MVKKRLSCTREKDKLLLEISAPDLEKKVKTALAEDIGSGDVTGRLIPETATVTAEITAGEKGIISGLPLAQLTFSSLDKKLEVKQKGLVRLPHPQRNCLGLFVVLPLCSYARASAKLRCPLHLEYICKNPKRRGDFSHRICRCRRRSMGCFPGQGNKFERSV